MQFVDCKELSAAWNAASLQKFPDGTADAPEGNTRKFYLFEQIFKLDKKLFCANFI